MLPLLLVAPLQQPFALLQFANRALAPGVQRMLQIVLGLLFCLLGEVLGGTLGLVTGLALAEALAGWAVVPSLARMRMFDRFAAYCARCLAAGVAAFTLCGLAGYAMEWYLPSTSLLALLVKLAVWILAAAFPAVVLALPDQVRRAFYGKFQTIIRSLPQRLGM